MKKAKLKKPAKSKSVKATPKASKPAKKKKVEAKKPDAKKKIDLKKVDTKPAVKSPTGKALPKAAAKAASKSLVSKAQDLAKDLGKKSAKTAEPLTGKAAARAAATAASGTAKAPSAKNVKLTKAEKNAEVLAQLQSIADEPEIVLTNADGKQYCRVHDCDNESTTEGLCRLHYLALWKRNKIKAKILQGGKLDKYIEDLTSKYPDKYLEMLRKDLASEKDFNLIIAEMDVEDSGDEAESEDDANRFIEEVRGGVPTSDDDDPGF